MLITRLSLTLALCCLPGCLSPNGGGYQTAQVSINNPLLIQSLDEEQVWERAVDVLHHLHFEIGNENRLGGTIETKPKTGSGLFEPWHQESVGFVNRLESSLQSVRRIVRIRIQPDDNGQGQLVRVEALKEFEDLPGVAANSAGAATFRDTSPLLRDLNQVVGQSTPSRWIPQGRDLDLEQELLRRLRVVYSQ